MWLDSHVAGVFCMLRRLMNLPFSVASRAARAFQDREDARTKQRYGTVEDPGTLEMRSGPSGGSNIDASVITMDVVTLKAMVSQNTPLAFVDLRDAAAFAASHVKGAMHMPYDTVGIRVSELPTDRMVVSYSHGDDDALAATRFFRERGMEDTWLMAGGFAAWVEAGGAVER